jgi:hypothetical protein
MTRKRCTVQELPLNSAVLLLAATILIGQPARCQQQSPSAQATASVINVVATDKHTRAPVDGLTQGDFEVFDDRVLVNVSSFVHSPSANLRPLSLWLVLQCPEEHPYFDFVSAGSGFLRGKVEALTAALQQLPVQETVGVAHWCDDGKSWIDLLPTTDRIAPTQSLNAVLNSPAVPIGTSLGEDALHDMVLRVRDASRLAGPGALPIVIFFYGDHSGMHHDEVNDLLDRPLGPLPMVYGINNGVIRVQKTPITDQYTQMYVVHFLGDQTGGQVLSNVHGDYAKELQQIVGELHGRYEIGFVPRNANGKRHELKVRFSEEARNKYKSVELRVAPQFLAAGQDLQSRDMQAALIQAIQSPVAYTEIAFDASGRLATSDAPAQFRVYINPDSLSWATLENGDRKTVLFLAVAGVSTQGSVIGQQIKQFEVQKTKEDQATAARKGVIVSFSFAVPRDADRVRFVLRDPSSGHLGSFELPSKRIVPSESIRPQ